MNNEYKSRQAIIVGLGFILIGVFLIVFQYISIYNIRDTDRYIVENLKNTSKMRNAEITVIDELKTDYGLVVLFETSVKDTPIGYAVFEKDGLLNRYNNEDFALYNNPTDYFGDMDALNDLKSKNVFKFDDKEVILVSSIDNTYGVVEYYCSILVVVLSFVYGVRICLKARLL